MKTYSFEEVNQFGHGFEVVPAILEQSIEAVKEKVARTLGKSKRLCVDIIDGMYADNLTVSVDDLVEVDFGDLMVEVQLMTEYPEELLGSCYKAGIKRAFGHVEKMGSQRDYVEVCKELKILPALGIDLYTPLESIEKGLLEELDGILLMSVKAGFSAQSFNPVVLDKIRALRKKGFKGDIQMDGGINVQTIRPCLEAGANQFSVTSFVWKHESVEEAIGELVGAVK